MARSVRGDDGLYSRRYPPLATRFAHALGYSYAFGIGRAGLERSRNDALVGETDEITSLVDDLRGRSRARSRSRSRGPGVWPRVDSGARTGRPRP